VIIDPCQGAFVKGRELLFNVLLCHNIAREYNRKACTIRCLMKVDFKMAYNSIYWEFVEERLISLIFPKVFIS